MRGARSKTNLANPLGYCSYKPEPRVFGICLEKCSPLVRKAVVRLMTDFRSDITIKKIAEELKVHPSHLERETRKYCDSTTLKQLLIGFRLQYAVFLMTETDLKLHDIPEMSEFPSGKDFSRSFHLHLGMTATEYRRHLTFEDFMDNYTSNRNLRQRECGI